MSLTQQVIRWAVGTLLALLAISGFVLFVWPWLWQEVFVHLLNQFLKGLP